LYKVSSYILFFGVIFSILFVCKANDITQFCWANDSFSLLYGAKFLELRYPAPLYTFVGWPVANFPFGVDASNLIIALSVIPAFLSSIVVFVLVKRESACRWAPWFGSIVLIGNYMYFSQSLIIEIYALLSLLMVSSFYMIKCKRYTTAVVLCGLAMSCHYMSGFFAFVAFFFYSPDFRRKSYIAIIVASLVLIPYYFLLPVFKWQTSSGNASLMAYNQVYGLLFKDFQTLSTNVVEIFRVFVVGFGLSLIPMILFAKNLRESCVFLFLLICPFAYMVINGEVSFVALVPFIPFAAIMAALGFERIRDNFSRYIIFSFSVIVLLSMPFVMNINQIDGNPTTARSMIDEIDEMKDGSVLLCVRVFKQGNGINCDTIGDNVAPLVEYYNKEKGGQIWPVKLSFIYSDTHAKEREMLEDNGISFPNLADTDLRELTKSELLLFVMNEFAIANPDRDVYYYEYLDFEKEEMHLRRVFT